MSDLIKQQTEQLAKVIQQQAQQAEDAMAATGIAVIEQLANQAMQQAHANAAARTVAHAADLLQSMAGNTGADLNVIADQAPAETIEAKVIDLQTVPIALPAGAKASLPQSVRMANAALPEATQPSSSAKRRARRTKAAEQATKADQS
jgi:hypothetical protein